jgi:hypothetical protein
MSELITQMFERIAAGLQRKSVTSASKWAEKYRVMGPPFPGKWSFKWHPWLRAMHDSRSERNYGQKASQVGFTEALLNIALYNIDVHGRDVLYVLPAKTPDASDFSSGRFDPALELSEHLSKMFTDVRNVGHKRAGTANLFVRGARSKGGLKSVPVGNLFLDEVEEFPKGSVELAMQRMSGQVNWQAWLASTPSLPEVGINLYYLRSTQEMYTFQCPSCSRWTDLSFPDCLEITAEDALDPNVENSILRCKECKNRLHHELKPEFLANGLWVANQKSSLGRGFHVNRLYSSADMARPSEMAKSYLLGLRDPTHATEFWNSEMGLPYQDKGAKLTEDEINQARQSYNNGKLRPHGIMTLGVDVGRDLHCWVDSWQTGQLLGNDVNTSARPKTLWIGKLPNFDDLDQLMQIWGIHACVIDRNPEQRMALQFANRFYGVVRLCIYGNSVTGKDIHVSKTEQHTVIVDRTSWMDLALSRFRREEMIYVPMDIPFEARQHLMTPVRVYKKDKMGNPVGYYENKDKPDHYAHARTYSEIAFTFAANVQVNRNITSPV